MMTIPELLREHVSLDLECVDRVYMNGYIPVLQSSGGLVYFLEQQRGQLIASPVMLGEITQSFAAQVEAYAKQENIPIVHFQKGLYCLPTSCVLFTHIDTPQWLPTS